MNPYLAKCGDRLTMPKSNPVSGSPEDWFSNNVLELNKLRGISFDFFINWAAVPSLTPILWIKKVVKPEFSYSQVIDVLSDTLIAEFGDEYLYCLKEFALAYKLRVQFILFRDDYNWADSNSNILMVDYVIDAERTFQFTALLIPIEEFKSTIRDYSGGKVNIGSKGLTYGTSNLECYLSGTDSLYPGDVDLIIFNQSSTPICIFEFKKHTLHSPISLQKLSNYYPNPDGRKYNRLAILQQYLNTPDFQLPLVVVYYPTNESETYGRMELLQGHPSNLSTKAACNFRLPASKTLTDFSSVFSVIMKEIYQLTSQASR